MSTATDLFNLTGRVALVTGASTGLGVRFAEVLADNGAAVALVARRADRLAAVKAQIEAKGGRALAIEADVLDRNAMTRAFDEAERARHACLGRGGNIGQLVQTGLRAHDQPFQLALLQQRHDRCCGRVDPV